MHPGQSQRQASSSTVTTSASDDPVERRKINHARRSSSPFEVKLSATVSKRVSLDAFGGAQEIATNSGQEEVLEDIQSGSDHSEHFSDNSAEISFDQPSSSQYTPAAVDLTDYRGTTLSTIAEVSSRDLVDPATILGDNKQATRYLTPPGSPNYVSRDSPFLPPRKHLSEPPLHQAHVLIEAHENHAKTLADQLQASERVVTCLQAETRRLRDALEEESDEKRKAFLDVGSVQRELLELEELCREKDLGECVITSFFRP